MKYKINIDGYNDVIAITKTDINDPFYFDIIQSYLLNDSISIQEKRKNSIYYNNNILNRFGNIKENGNEKTIVLKNGIFINEKYFVKYDISNEISKEKIICKISVYKKDDEKILVINSDEIELTNNKIEISTSTNPEINDIPEMINSTATIECVKYSTINYNNNETNLLFDYNISTNIFENVKNITFLLNITEITNKYNINISENSTTLNFSSPIYIPLSSIIYIPPQNISFYVEEISSSENGVHSYKCILENDFITKNKKSDFVSIDDLNDESIVDDLKGVSFYPDTNGANLINDLLYKELAESFTTNLLNDYFIKPIRTTEFLLYKNLTNCFYFYNPLQNKFEKIDNLSTKDIIENGFNLVEFNINNPDVRNILIAKNKFNKPIFKFINKTLTKDAYLVDNDLKEKYYYSENGFNICVGETYYEPHNAFPANVLISLYKTRKSFIDPIDIKNTTKVNTYMANGIMQIETSKNNTTQNLNAIKAENIVKFVSSNPIIPKRVDNDKIYIDSIIPQLITYEQTKTYFRLFRYKENDKYKYKLIPTSSKDIKNYDLEGLKQVISEQPEYWSKTITNVSNMMESKIVDISANFVIENKNTRKELNQISPKDIITEDELGCIDINETVKNVYLQEQNKCPFCHNETDNTGLYFEIRTILKQTIKQAQQGIYVDVNFGQIDYKIDLTTNNGYTLSSSADIQCSIEKVFNDANQDIILIKLTGEDAYIEKFRTIKIIPDRTINRATHYIIQIGLNMCYFFVYNFGGKPFIETEYQTIKSSINSDMENYQILTDIDTYNAISKKINKMNKSSYIFKKIEKIDETNVLNNEIELDFPFKFTYKLQPLITTSINISVNGNLKETKITANPIDFYEFETENGSTIEDEKIPTTYFKYYRRLINSPFPEDVIWKPNDESIVDYLTERFNNTLDLYGMYDYNKIKIITVDNFCFDAKKISSTLDNTVSDGTPPVITLQNLKIYSDLDTNTIYLGEKIDEKKVYNETNTVWNRIMSSFDGTISESFNYLEKGMQYGMGGIGLPIGAIVGFIKDYNDNSDIEEMVKEKIQQMKEDNSAHLLTNMKLYGERYIGFNFPIYKIPVNDNEATINITLYNNVFDYNYTLFNSTDLANKININLIYPQNSIMSINLFDQLVSSVTLSVKIDYPVSDIKNEIFSSFDSDTYISFTSFGDTITSKSFNFRTQKVEPFDNNIVFSPKYFSFSIVKENEPDNFKSVVEYGQNNNIDYSISVNNEWKKINHSFTNQGVLLKLSENEKDTSFVKFKIDNTNFTQMLTDYCDSLKKIKKDFNIDYQNLTFKLFVYCDSYAKITITGLNENNYSQTTTSIYYLKEGINILPLKNMGTPLDGISIEAELEKGKKIVFLCILITNDIQQIDEYRTLKHQQS